MVENKKTVIGELEGFLKDFLVTNAVREVDNYTDFRIILKTDHIQNLKKLPRRGKKYLIRISEIIVDE